MICEDPRQYVPPNGQEWSSLYELWEKGYTFNVKEDVDDERVKFISTEPGFGIGQNRMFLILLDDSMSTWNGRVR